MLLIVNTGDKYCFDQDWSASNLILQENNTIVEKHDGQHGIIFTKAPLDSNFQYIEFNINMKIPSSGNSHIFIGLVDKSKYKIEYLCKLILYYQLLIYFLYHIIYNLQ